jgi:non-homologous end joining protein Ku
MARSGNQAFAVIREAIRKEGMVALGRYRDIRKRQREYRDRGRGMMLGAQNL